MKILHYCPSEMGNRHYKKVSIKLLDYLRNCDDKYWVCKRAYPYKRELEKRVEKNDILLITAHGGAAGILQAKPMRIREIQRTKYDYAISREEANLFKNNITFSFACYTALRFGSIVIDNGGQAYIGFKSEIGALTKVSTDSGHNKQMRKAYEYVAKIILTSTIAECIYKYIFDFQTAEVCMQWFSLTLEQRLVEFFEMSSIQVLKIYGYKIDKGVWAKHKGQLGIYQLNILKTIQDNMVCMGDKNYISMLGFYLRDEIPEEIIDNVRKTTFQDVEYSRKFKECLNKYLDDHGRND